MVMLILFQDLNYVFTISKFLSFARFVNKLPSLVYKNINMTQNSYIYVSTSMN